jgi:hypothetical protein
VKSQRWKGGYSGWFNLALPPRHSSNTQLHLGLDSVASDEHQPGEGGCDGIFGILRHIRKEYRKFVNDKND